MDNEKVAYEFTNTWFTRHIPNWQRFLGHLKDKPLDYLEIGSYEGQSAIWMLENILTNKVCLTTLIDVFEEPTLEDRFAKNIWPFMSRVTVKKSFSFQALSSLVTKGLTYDVIYVDGSHKAKHALEDLVISWNLLKTGGILIADDLIWNGSTNPYEKPEMGIEAFLKIYGPELQILHKEVQLFVRKKNGMGSVGNDK